MTEQNLDRAAILATLADRLPDELLAKLFPGHSASAIRRVLTGEKKTATIPPRPQKLFADPAEGKSLECRLYTDGASRGNPGQAGAGIALFDNQGRELAARSAYLGRCTNNIAEYRALVLGLETALELGCTSLAVFMDSQLIVRQVTGRYKVKNAGIKPLFQEVRELLGRFDSWTINHVPRAENKRADELANRGIDEK